MESVKERVASLEKKLEFVDLNMDDHGAEAEVRTPPSHEPEQPSHVDTEPIIPDPRPVSESVPNPEPHIEIIPNSERVPTESIPVTIPEFNPILESVNTEVAEPAAKPSPTPVMKCYIRKPKPHIEPTTESPL